jgi:ABC-type Fe3+ transport system substrate-binding protein
MKREELEHVLRASAAITADTSFVVIGSQAVLLPYPDAPAELLLSNEVDLYPAMHPERAELIDGAIGHMSMFHDTFGYHADGVGPDTAKMPSDWMQFAKLYYIGEITVVSPDLHDVAVSKCVAAREKDADWIRALLKHRMIDATRLEARLRELDPSIRPIEQLVAWARRRAREALA